MLTLYLLLASGALLRLSNSLMPPNYRRAARKTLGLTPACQLWLAPGKAAKQYHYLFGIWIFCWHTRGVPEFSIPDEPCVLLKRGEIVLKGRNRQQFER